MAAYYLDSNALVKRYAQETGSAWIISLTNPQAGTATCTALVTGVESVEAVTRSERMGSIAEHDAMAAVTIFKHHFKNENRIVLMTTGIINRAKDRAQQYGLRGYDAIQLASALTVQADLPANAVDSFVFVSADRHLNEAAHGSTCLRPMSADVIDALAEGRLEKRG